MFSSMNFIYYSAFGTQSAGSMHRVSEGLSKSHRYYSQGRRPILCYIDPLPNLCKSPLDYTSFFVITDHDGRCASCLCHMFFVHVAVSRPKICMYRAIKPFPSSVNRTHWFRMICKKPFFLSLIIVLDFSARFDFGIAPFFTLSVCIFFFLSSSL